MLLALCCIIAVKQKKKQLAIKKRNRTNSHNYIIEPTTMTSELTGPNKSAVTLPISIREAPILEVSGTSRRHTCTDILLLQKEKTIDDFDCLKTSLANKNAKIFNHWKSVFSSVLVVKGNLNITDISLGEGAFGKVYKGLLQTKGHNGNIIEREVAVKTLKCKVMY
jgi:hypothetical protein